MDDQYQHQTLKYRQNRTNISRVANLLNRSIPSTDNLEDIISSFVVCRIRSLKSVEWLNQGIRGTNEEVVVLLPLETWGSDNGLFWPSQVKPGQYMCVEGNEAVPFPGTGGLLNPASLSEIAQGW